MKTRISGFTLIELLVVIAILGILAALTVPALKNLGKGNVQASASRQLLDDIGRARQLAMSDHTTVYMVFVNTNFWVSPTVPTWQSQLNAAEKAVLTNLVDKQMSGYTFVAYGALGDQPGRHQWHYLAPWQALPAGYMIAPWKFNNGNLPAGYFSFKDPVNDHLFTVYPFDVTNNIPFPLADATMEQLAAGKELPLVPYIAFNYLGQLVSSAKDQDVAGGGVDIPLAQGSVSYPLDGATKSPLIPATSLGVKAVSESPAGNSTNITYTVVHIDALTGRATLEYHVVQ